MALLVYRSKYDPSRKILTLNNVVSGVVESCPLWSAPLSCDRSVFSKSNLATDFASLYDLIFSSVSRVEGVAQLW